MRRLCGNHVSSFVLFEEHQRGGATEVDVLELAIASLLRGQKHPPDCYDTPSIWPLGLSVNEDADDF